MIRITLTLTGALAALAFSAATAHADRRRTHSNWPGVQYHLGCRPPMGGRETWDQEYGVLNAPAETFEGIVRNDYDLCSRTTTTFRRPGPRRQRPPRGAVQRLLSPSAALATGATLRPGLQRHRWHAGGFLHHAVR